jgi:rubrerythrin
MAELKGSKTEANLEAAFTGESKARGKYIYFAKKAKEEGYGEAARFFEEAALNEQEHARMWFNYLGHVGTTSDNIAEAIKGEHSENSEMYPDFAKTAKEEGFDEIAKHFEAVGKIEKGHEKKFTALQGNLKKSAPANEWKCVNCGCTIEANSAPQKCQVCGASDTWDGSYRAFVQVRD